MAALPTTGTGRHVLLTGANGFIAAHILADLVDRGYSVTAVVRSEAKAQGMLRSHPTWQDRVDFAYVPDLTVEGAFDKVFTDSKVPFDYVIHAASPVVFHVEDVQRDILDPAVRGTTDIIKSAHKYAGSTLKRFVLLGSSVAILDSFEDMSRPGKDYTEKDWNPVTGAQAVEKKDGLLAYNASKKLAEQAAWDLMDQLKPGFDLTVINPVVVIGPMTHELTGPGSVNNTNGFAVYSFINGTHKQIDGVQFAFWDFVDVRDVARAHVDSLTNPSASNKRIMLNSGILSPQLVVNIIRKNFPDLRDRVPEGDPSTIYPKGIRPTGWDKRESLEILGKGTQAKTWEYIDLEKSVTDTVQSILDAKLI